MAAPSGGETTGGCQLLSKPPALEGVIGDKSAANMLKGEACNDDIPLLPLVLYDKMVSLAHCHCSFIPHSAVYCTLCFHYTAHSSICCGPVP